MVFSSRFRGWLFFGSCDRPWIPWIMWLVVGVIGHVLLLRSYALLLDWVVFLSWDVGVWCLGLGLVLVGLGVSLVFW